MVVVLLDDLGFAHLNCFGSDLTTPHLDELAAGGLRYSNFHVTPLCSPTRAALLTGRNHHQVGMRGISNWQTGYPHMRGVISPHAGTVAEVLQSSGYATFAVGKWHLVSMEQASSAGPFDSWPLGRGFERFYGFLDGETDQFAPDLVYDNHRVAPPRTAAEGYHLSEDLVDHALDFVHDSVSLRPDRPFFLYLAFGATHAPHQAPPEYLARHRGRYDEGWDVARERWFSSQLESGIVPSHSELAPRNPGVEPWESLSGNERRLAARLQEAFAAFLEHTDAQIGRLVDDLRALGQLENTVLFVLSDNGASQEGGPFGVLHEMKYFNFVFETPDEAVTRIDDIGGPHSHSNYPWGWAMAGNTPFKWYKQNTHEGGVHVPLLVHWPRGIESAGEVRSNFHYVTDIAATIYDVTGIAPPSELGGVVQWPLAGVSLKSGFIHASEDLPHATQYFEMMGHRAIFHNGMKAVTRHRPGDSYDDDRWELYDLNLDPSECHDLALSRPETLRELIDLWWDEAERNGVLPLDDRNIELFAPRFSESSVHPVSRHYVYYPPVSLIPPQSAAPLGGRSFRVDALVGEYNSHEGVLLATGNENAGLSWFVQSGRLVFDYNVFGEHHVITSGPIAEGSRNFGLDFRRSSEGANVRLLVENRSVGEGRLPFLMRIISSSGLSVGRDDSSPVSLHYDGAFDYSGNLERVEIQLISRDGSAESEGREGMARQ